MFIGDQLPDSNGISQNTAAANFGNIPLIVACLVNGLAFTSVLLVECSRAVWREHLDVSQAVDTG